MNNDIRELNINELNTVTGDDTPFYGMGCSAHGSEIIGGIVGVLGSIPVVGGTLANVATAVGQAICAA